MIKRRINTSRTRGASLLELLLSIGLLAGILAVGTYITTQYTRFIANERAAQQMLTVQRAGEQFARTNFTQLMDAAIADNIAAAGNVRILTVNDLINANFLPNNFAPINLLQQTMRVWLGNITLAGGQQMIGVVTATGGNAGDTPQPFQWIFDTAQFGQGKLGILSNVGVGGFNNVSFTSISNEWNVPIAALTGYAPVMPAAANDPSGYIAAYGTVNVEDIFDNNVLYRIPVAGQPELNQMQVNLDMNNNALNGVGTITADDVNVNGNAIINKVSGGGYALTTDATLSMTGNTAISNGNMTVYADADAVTNDLSADSLDVNGGTIVASQINATGTLQTSDLTANNLTASDPAGATQSGEIFVAGRTAMSGLPAITSTNLQVSGNVTAQDVNTANLLVANTTVNNNFTVTSDGDHEVARNAVVRALTVTIPTLAAETVQFTNLCYTGGAQDDIEECP